MLVPDKHDESDTSEKRRPKPRIEFKATPAQLTRKEDNRSTNTAAIGAKKTTVMNDLDAFFGEVVEDRKEVDISSKPPPEKEENTQDDEEDVEYVYEEVEEESTVAAADSHNANNTKLPN